MPYKGCLWHRLILFTAQTILKDSFSHEIDQKITLRSNHSTSSAQKKCTSLERDFVNLHNFSCRSLDIVDFQTRQKWEQKLTRRRSSTDEIL